MKKFWVIMVFCSTSIFGFSQDSIFPTKQTYSLFKDSSSITFTWNHDGKQELNMSTLYGGEHCEVYVINNTDKAIRFDSICNADKYPITWLPLSSQREYLPNDTIKIKSKLTQFYGKVDFSMRLCYTLGDTLNYKEVFIKGVLIDSMSITTAKSSLPTKELDRLRKKNRDNTYYASGVLKSIK